MPAQTTAAAPSSADTTPPRDGSPSSALLAPEVGDALAVASAPLGSLRVGTASPDTARVADTAPGALPAGRPPEPEGYELERPFLPGPVYTEEEVKKASPVLLGGRTETAARWNLGGSSSEQYPSSSPTFHPGTRVVVDVTLAGVFGATAKNDAVERQTQARARARGYWPLRVCYEAAWRHGHDQPTDHTIRATVNGAGRVQATRILKAKGPDELGTCLREALRQVDLGPLPARRIDADLRVRFWPGDARVPRDAELGDDACTADAAVKPLEKAQEAWQASTEALNACVAPALAHDEKLWGRLALRARFDREGRARQAAEFRTTFPDPAVVTCVRRSLGRVELGPQPCPAEIVFVLRVGEFPGAPQ